MNNANNLTVYEVTNIESDRHLVDDIAQMEQLVQPVDSWRKQIIIDLLNQDINQCWVITEPCLLQDVDGSHRCQAVAYCLVSSIFETAEILRIGTHPQFQRRGYAQALIEFIIQKMPETALEKIMLEVRADNTAAIKLYQKMGFNIIHTRKGYYSSVDDAGVHHKCDALIMVYTLTTP